MASVERLSTKPPIEGANGHRSAAIEVMHAKRAKHRK